MPTSHNRQSIQHCRWIPFRDSEALTNAALAHIMTSARDAIAARGTFHIVLAGGTTPKQIYTALRNQPADWPAWHIYFGDERCLPIDHPERNSRMAQDAWLSYVPIPATQIHPIPTEIGLANTATAYAAIVRSVDFDLVLLGLGEDGHTASLFPNHPLGDTPDAADIVCITDAPKPPPERVSLSANKISQAREVLFLVTGKSKQQAVDDWRTGRSIPAAAIAPSNGVDIYLDAELLAP